MSLVICQLVDESCSCMDTNCLVMSKWHNNLYWLQMYVWGEYGYKKVLVPVINDNVIYSDIAPDNKAPPFFEIWRDALKGARQ